MMMVYFMVATLCSGGEGCLDERKPMAYATQAECVEAASALEPRRGVKYRCHRGPQTLISQELRHKKAPHLTASHDALEGPAGAVTVTP